MADLPAHATVVVGVDGSQAAIHAVLWAVDEALARDLPLRLVHVRPTEPTVGPPSLAVPLGVEYAETVLRKAHAAILASGKAVKVDTAILEGDPTSVLLTESRNAELVCIGSTGIGVVARRVLGSKATALAEAVHCPIAIIRERDADEDADRRWIAVAVKPSIDDEDIVVAALEEARLRRTPLLAIGLWDKDFGFTPYDELDRLLEEWRQRYPDVHVHPATTRSGLAHFLAQEHVLIDLVVVGAGDARLLAQIVGPHGHQIVEHSECSVLIVRH